MSVHCRLLSVAVLAVFVLSFTICGWLLAIPAAGLVALLDGAAKWGDHRARH